MNPHDVASVVPLSVRDGSGATANSPGRMSRCHDASILLSGSVGRPAPTPLPQCPIRAGVTFRGARSIRTDGAASCGEPGSGTVTRPSPSSSRGARGSSSRVRFGCRSAGAARSSGCRRPSPDQAVTGEGDQPEVGDPPGHGRFPYPPDSSIRITDRLSVGLAKEISERRKPRDVNGLRQGRKTAPKWQDYPIAIGRRVGREGAVGVGHRHRGAGRMDGVAGIHRQPAGAARI